MRLEIPLTGTVLVEGSIGGAGKLTGAPDDPIRPVSLDLGNVSWVMLNVDLEKGVMEIEVKPGEDVSEDTGEVDGEGKPIYTTRKATQQEKVGFLQQAQHLVESHTKEELYTLSKSPKLKRPFKEKK